MSLEILEVYGSVGLHGLRKPGLRCFGVPPGGAFDTVSFGIANALLENEPQSPCLELAMASMTVRARESVSFAWVGAGASQSTCPIDRGAEFRFMFPEVGCRSYLAMPGGVRVEGRIGKGAILSGTRNIEPVSRQIPGPPASLGRLPLRVVKGPQASLLLFETLLGTEFTVSRYLDRIGVRLEPQPDLRHGIELPSEPATVGAIQITPDGSPIILGPDGPTIGGYPKIGVVIRDDMSLVAQLKPQDRVRFEVVSVEAARVRSARSWPAVSGPVGPS